jgi:hypothetical protein
MHLRWRFASLAAVLFAAGCNSNGYCPGLCPMEDVYPTMTIEVADGTASIANARVASGPCAHLLVQSAGEAGATTGYAAVQVTYSGPSDHPPLCLIELTSQDGETVVVTASVSATSYQKPCCPYGSCCPKASAISLHDHVVFDQPVQTISFPGPPDGGMKGDAASATQAVDGETVDSTGEIDGGAIDAAETDIVDAATPVDVPIDR